MLVLLKVNSKHLERVKPLTEISGEGRPGGRGLRRDREAGAFFTSFVLTTSKKANFNLLEYST